MWSDIRGVIWRNSQNTNSADQVVTTTVYEPASSFCFFVNTVWSLNYHHTSKPAKKDVNQPMALLS